MKSKTSIVALLAGIVFLGLTAALIFYKIDGATYGTSLAAAGGFATVLIGIFAADNKPKG